MNVARSRVIYSGQLCRNKVFSVAQIVDLDALTDGRETGAAKWAHDKIIVSGNDMNKCKRVVRGARGAGLAALSLGLLWRLHCEPLRWLQPQPLAPLQLTLIFLHVESFRERHTAHSSLAISWIFYFSRHLNLKSQYKFLPPPFYQVEGMWCGEDRNQAKLLRMINTGILFRNSHCSGVKTPNMKKKSMYVVINVHLRFVRR